MIKCPANYALQEGKNSNLILGLTYEMTQTQMVTLMLLIGIFGIDLTGHFVMVIKI